MVAILSFLGFFESGFGFGFFCFFVDLGKDLDSLDLEFWEELDIESVGVGEDIHTVLIIAFGSDCFFEAN